MSLLRGEWWIDDSGSTTFADGDVGDTNHEAYAWNSFVGVDEHQIGELQDIGSFDPNELDLDEFGIHKLTEDGKSEEEIEEMDQKDIDEAGWEFLEEEGVDIEFLQWLLKTGKDARDFAMEKHGWIRVQNDNFQFWKLDDKTLKNIRDCEIWEEITDEDGEQPEDLETFLESSDEEIGLEERSTGKYVNIPLRVLFDKNLSPARILSYGERAAPGQSEDEGFSLTNPGKRKRK
jgi:hypothetical protein